ncbi:MAG TPA: ferritin-like domain-containing protein [Polyangiaceae bacterium]
MRLRVRTDSWTTLFLTALGLNPLSIACGGAFTSGTTETGGTAGSTATGAGGAPTTTVSTGVGGNVGGSTSVGGSAGRAGNPFPCLDPTPVVNESSGYVKCQSGYLHRPEKTTCPSFVPRPTPIFDGGVADGGFNSCSSDADCTAAPHGYCGYASFAGGPLSGPTCTYGCVRDEECPTGRICLCGDPVGTCVNATCQSDADCGPLLTCASYTLNPGCPSTAFACQTYGDQCGGNGDCPLGKQCTVQAGQRVCQSPFCVIGRPFLVDNAERLAGTRRRGDWRARGVDPRVAHLGAESRARLAEAWTRIALMEHASIAAFARFTLQLMSLGAPAELIECSHAAMGDETLHAKLAFAVASAYAGQEVGPSLLPIEGALDASSLRDVVATTIREGCIGETIAAIEAAEALQHASDPAIRAVLSRIADDETRHAELAWRFLRWAIADGGADIRLLAKRELFGSVELAGGAEGARRVTQAAGRADGPRRVTQLAGGAEGPRRVTQTDAPTLGPAFEPSAGDRELLEGGIVPDALRRQVRSEVMSRVVLVCARALFGEQPDGAVGGHAQAGPTARAE